MDGCWLVLRLVVLCGMDLWFGDVSLCDCVVMNSQTTRQSRLAILNRLIPDL